MNKILGIILGFTIFAVLGLFLSVFIFQVGDQFILSEIQDYTNSTNLAVSSNMENHINSMPAKYRDLNVPYDLAFLLSFIIVFSSSIFSAYKSKEQGWLSFFGTITIGLMFLLFVTGYIEIIKDWFILNLIENFLGFQLATTPIFYFYLENLGIINFIWAIILIGVNKLNFSEIRETDDLISGGSFQK